MRLGDTVCIHPEAEYHPSTTVQKVIDAGMIPGIAINHGISVENIYELLKIVNKLLVMVVNSGSTSQIFMSYVKPKFESLLGLMKRIISAFTGMELVMRIR